MYKICPPTISAAKAFQATAESISNREKRRKHLQCTSFVEEKCREYDNLGQSAIFETALPSSFEVLNLGSSAMQELYDKRFVKLKGTREIRDLIKSGAENNSCPYCGIGSASQLDHYLPKSEFHAITVHPNNLVPSCADCNTAKRAYRPSANSPAVFHPYFDDEVFDRRWLSATLQRGPDGRAVAMFGVDENIADVQLRRRMLKHLDIFNLQNRFSSFASQLIQEFERIYRNNIQGSTLESAKSQLRSEIRVTSSLRANDYRAATYTAMLTTPWYLETFVPPN